MQNNHLGTGNSPGWQQFDKCLFYEKLLLYLIKNSDFTAFLCEPLQA